MDNPHPQLERIEQLLREGNAMRAEAIAFQKEALAMQRTLVEEQRANLAKAEKINEGALAIQKRARGLTGIVIPVILLALVYVGYLLFVGSIR